MLLAFLWSCLAITVLALILGWKHQARKSPEEQHLDLLIDLNDPGVVAYVTKVWGPPLFGAIDDQGQPHLLI